MFDAANYVQGPYLYGCWSLVLFWALFVAFWWLFLSLRHILQRNVIVQSFLRLLKLRKLALCKLDLGGLTRCHGVLEHGLNLHRNIPLMFLGRTWAIKNSSSVILSLCITVYAAVSCHDSAPKLLLTHFLLPKKSQHASPLLNTLLFALCH